MQPQGCQLGEQLVPLWGRRKGVPPSMYAGIHGLASRAWAGFHCLGRTLLYSVQTVPLYMTGLPVQVEMEIKEKEEIR